MTAWLVSPLIIESSHRILIAAAAFRFHLDYVNLLILRSYIMLQSLRLGGLSWDDVITYISVVFELRRFLSAVLRERLFNFGSIEKN